EALHLLGLQPAKFLAPPIIRHLAHPDLADCVHHVLALRDQNIDLPQLRNDLFRLVSLPCHCSPPGCQRHTSSRTTSMGVDHSTRSPIERNRLLSPPSMSGSSSITNTIGSSGAETGEVPRTPSFMRRFPVSLLCRCR